MRFRLLHLASSLTVFCLLPVIHGSATAAAAKSGSGRLADLKQLIAEQQKRMADYDRRIADSRKQAKMLADREKSLETQIAAKKKEQAAQREISIKSRPTPAKLKQSPAETSPSSATQRQVGADLAQSVATSTVAAWREIVAQYVHLSSTARSSESFLSYLVAPVAKAEDSLPQTRGHSNPRVKHLHPREQATSVSVSGQSRDTSPAAQSPDGEILRLEKEMARVRDERQSLLERAEMLSRTRQAIEKETARLVAFQKGLSTSKTSGGSPAAAKSAPTVSGPSPQAGPPLPLPSNVRPGTALDFLIQDGTEIHAIDAGEVLHADRFRGYGNLVILEHADKTLSLYGFLNQIEVVSGATVARGDVIGRSGYIEDKDRSGFRFEMRVTRGDREELIDPRSWLPEGADLQRRLLGGTD